MRVHSPLRVDLGERSCRCVIKEAMITASMLPDAFFERGIHVMAGIRIVDPDGMIKILKQAGSGYHLLHHCSEKIAFVKQS
jgi:uncharacterized protein (DUF4213/DUF364 family)